MKMLSIGFGNYVSPIHVISIVSPESAPLKRLVTEGKDKGIVIDASFGRSTKSVIIMDNGSLILSALSADALSDKALEISEEGS